MAMNPETKRLKQLTKEWSHEGFTDDYARKAAYLHMRAEELEAAVGEYRAALDALRSILDSGKRPSLQERNALSDSFNTLQKQLEYAKTAQSTHPFRRERGWPEYVPGDPHNRILDLARNFDQEITDAAELKRLTFGALSLDPTRARAAVHAIPLSRL